MAEYTQQLNEIVEFVRRQPAVPQWITAIVGAVIGGAIGFGSSLSMSAINRRKERETLNESLCAELDMIFSELRAHVVFLKQLGDQESPSETNFSGFVKADLFQAVQGSPLFWSLNSSRQLIEAHRLLKFLTIRKPSNTKGDVISIEMVLGNVAKTVETKATSSYLQDINIS